MKISEKKTKNNFKELENLTKGFGSEKRLNVLFLLGRRSDLSLSEIEKALKIDIKNLSQHLKIMEEADLVVKSRRGIFVYPRLTTWGQKVSSFLKNRK